ncbi:MAG: O-antigen ligase family protein [Clostridia bacterium]|nr:O-antigen ligase family protein [Clostridia bacterium]
MGSPKVTVSSKYDFILSALIAIVIVAQGSYFPSQYLSALIVFCVLVLYKVRVRSIDFNSGAFIPVFLLAVVYLLSTFFAADNRYTAALETFKILCFCMAYVAAYFQNDRLAVFKGILGGCVIVCILGLLFYVDIFYFPRAVLDEGKNLRLQSLFQYANIAGLFMGIGFFMARYFLEGCSTYKHKAKYYIYSHILLTGLMLTLSRGAILVFFIMVFVHMVIVRSFKETAYTITHATIAAATAYLMNVFAVNKNYGAATFMLLLSVLAAAYIFNLLERHENYIKRYWGVFVILPMAGAIALVSRGSSGVGRMFNISFFEGTLIERYIYVQDALSVVSKNLLFGLGPGNWDSKQFSFQTAQYYSRYIHNGFVQFVTDAGIPAFTLVAIILVMFFKVTAKQYKATKDRYYLTLGIVVAFIIVHSFIDVGLSFSSILIIIAALISSGMREAKFTGTLKVVSWAKPIKVVVNAGVIILLFVSAIYFTGQLIMDSNQAAIDSGDFDKAVSGYLIAKYLRPFDPEVYLGMASCYRSMGKSPELIVETYSNARSLDKFQPKVLRDIIDYRQSVGDDIQTYEASKLLISIQPLSKEGYELALETLDRLRQDAKIDASIFKGEKEKIRGLLFEAKSRVNTLSSYLRNQTPLPTIN